MQGNITEPHPGDIAPRCSRALDKARRYSVYEEGDGVLSAYFSSPPSLAASRLLEETAGDRKLLLLSGSRRPASGIPLPGRHALYSPDALSELASPAEAILLESVGRVDSLEDRLPSSLLCAPQHALPRELGALFALVLPDRQHFTLFTRDRELLGRLLVCQLRLSAGPALPETLRDQLTVPQEPGSWREIIHQNEGGVQKLSVLTHSSDAGAVVGERLECVAPQSGGFWRAGWSW